MDNVPSRLGNLSQFALRLFESFHSLTLSISEPQDKIDEAESLSWSALDGTSAEAFWCFLFWRYLNIKSFKVSVGT